MSFDNPPIAQAPAHRYRVARLLLIDTIVLVWVLTIVTITLLPRPPLIAVAVTLGLASTAVNLVIIRQLGTAPRRRTRALAMPSDGAL